MQCWMLHNNLNILHNKPNQSSFNFICQFCSSTKWDIETCIAMLSFHGIINNLNYYSTTNSSIIHWVRYAVQSSSFSILLFKITAVRISRLKWIKLTNSWTMTSFHVRKWFRMTSWFEKSIYFIDISYSYLRK